MVGVVIVLVVLAIVAMMGVGIYNRLVRLRNQVERAWANIDVILKQRFDELPQLMQVIEQYAQYEAGVIEKVSEARTRYGQASTVPEKIQASTEMSLALRGVMAIGENYPELHADENFMQLQNRISQLENTIADRREIYNETIATFNTRIEQLPEVFVARMLGYRRQVMFKAEGAERKPVNLKMNLPDFKKGA